MILWRKCVGCDGGISRRGLARCLLAAAMCLAVLPVSAWAQSKAALVIGQALYDRAPAVSGAGEDAATVAAALAADGYSVTVLTDVGGDAFRAGIEAFRQLAIGADSVVVYYVGQAVASATVMGALTTDARLEDDHDLDKDVVNLSVLGALTWDKEFSLLVVDAANANPAVRASPLVYAPPAVARGMPEMLGHIARGSFVLYSAKAGTVSVRDSSPSPFAAAFAGRFAEAGGDPRKLFRLVIADVAAATQVRQIPYAYGQTLDEYDAWFLAEQSNTRAGFQRFVDAFPEGQKADLAHSILADYERPVDRELEALRQASSIRIISGTELPRGWLGTDFEFARMGPEFRGRIQCTAGRENTTIGDLIVSTTDVDAVLEMLSQVAASPGLYQPVPRASHVSPSSTAVFQTGLGTVALNSTSRASFARPWRLFLPNGGTRVVDSDLPGMAIGQLIALMGQAQCTEWNRDHSSTLRIRP